MFKTAFAGLLALWLSTFGGLATAQGVSPESVPGGAFIGYYLEDAGNNPEDPTAGALSLNLPAADGPFGGSMFFTYVGCQTRNVGEVRGTKRARQLDGGWSGTVDGLALTGSYTGAFDAASQSFTGTYTNASGKVHRDLRPCIEYDIAALGTWALFPVDARLPANFDVRILGRNIVWLPVRGAHTALVYVMDADPAPGRGDPVVWQNFGPVMGVVAIPADVTLTPGRPYRVVCVVFDTASRRIAQASRRFGG